MKSHPNKNSRQKTHSIASPTIYTTGDGLEPLKPKRKRKHRASSRNGPVVIIQPPQGGDYIPPPTKMTSRGRSFTVKKADVGRCPMCTEKIVMWERVHFDHAGLITHTSCVQREEST